MKPRELLDKTNCGSRGNSSLISPLQNYYNTNCVIAYIENQIGIIFIIKGSRKYYCYVSIKESFRFGGFDYRITRINIKDISSIKDFIIVDEKEFNKLKDLLIINAL